MHACWNHYHSPTTYSPGTGEYYSSSNLLLFYFPLLSCEMLATSVNSQNHSCVEVDILVSQTASLQPLL